MPSIGSRLRPYTILNRGGVGPIQRGGMSTKLRFGNRSIPLPDNRWVRIAIGILLVLGGFVGFLPILGFWMVPLGLLVLSMDIPAVRRARRRMEVKFLPAWRRFRRRAEAKWRHWRHGGRAKRKGGKAGEA